MPPELLTRRHLNRATLARQLLLRREKVSAVEAVRRLCGLQAQEPKPPFVGLWTRLDPFDRQDLRDALRERAIVRATLMRGTLHLLGAEDYLALRAALQPTLTRALGSLGNRQRGLDLEALLPVARRHLADGPLPFDRLRPLLAAAFPDADERMLGYAVRTHLPLVMVPTEDPWGFPAVSAFALAEQWLGEAPASDASPHELLRRYLAAFGPATAADAQAWSGLPGLKGAMDDLRPTLRVFTDEAGRSLFDLPDAPRPDPDTPAPPRFLPEFDNLVLAHADRTRVLADAHRPRVVTKNLRVHATFLWDGFVAGTWRIERRKQAATLHLAPFAPLPDAALADLTAEGEALLRFVEPDAAATAVAVGSGAV